MIYKVYPVLHFCTCFASLLGGFAVVRSVTSAAWPLLLIPVPAVLVGYVLSSVGVSMFPRIRFVNDAEVDGLGYVHQPLGAMLLVAATGFGVAAIWLVR
jgi:hypothetical protein